MHAEIQQDLRVLIRKAKQNTRYYNTDVSIPDDEDAYIKLAGQLIVALQDFSQHQFAE